MFNQSHVWAGRVNDSKYGLQAGIFTHDLDKVRLLLTTSFTCFEMSTSTCVARLVLRFLAPCAARLRSAVPVCASALMRRVKCILYAQVEW